MSEWNYITFWDESLSQLKNEQGEEDYSIWFGKLGYIRAEETVIYASVPSNFFLEMIRAKYLPDLQKKITELSGKNISIVLEVKKTTKNQEDPVTQVEEKTTKIQTISQKPAPAAVSIATEPKNNHPDLQEEYTFESYVVGELNSYAYSAATAIAKNPGSSRIYNPLLIYGGTGLGKTHLMQAIGHYIHQNSEHKILYITGEGFMREFVELMQSNVKNKDTFAKKYRNVDVLLIDDIHTIERGMGTQDELFYTFEALYNKKKQMVFTCDRPITELKGIVPRLQSRFQKGISVELQLPQFEELIAILKKKVELKKLELQKDIEISDGIIELIIKNISTNVRDMEGALNILIGYSDLVNKPVTMEIAQRQLKDIFADPKQANMSIDIIQKIVTEEFGLKPDDLKSKKRSTSIAKPRQIAMFLCRELTEFSQTEIGEFFGGRDHTTVIHSVKVTEERIRSDTNLYTTVERLKRKVKEFNVK